MADEIVEIFARLELPTQAQIDGLRRCGVPVRAMIFDSSDSPVELRRAFVEFLPGNRFVFEAENTSGVVHDALIVAANDEFDEPADLCAFDFQGRFASWLGIPVLGLENALLPRMSDALPVHRTPIDWLQNFRHGVVIVNAKMARHYLENSGPFVVCDSEHGRHLMAALSFKPEIFIQSARAAA